jgi:assimilatory nitrate reductase catalytic subunit
MAEGWKRTTCPYCGVGCGVLAKPVPDAPGAVFAEIKGDPDHPANFGRLCSKGSALGETLSLDDRLLHPIVDGRQVSWDDALDRVAGEFRRAIDTYGPDSVAMYVSGQILTEDYYVANKFMKGFVGSANIDTNSRLCMASSVAGHRRAFGSDTVPGCYEDLEEADLVVLVGSNLAWCHPVLFQRLSAARDKRGTKIVVIDPRETATCEIADLHLPIKPGSDVILFNGLLAHLAAAGYVDHDFIETSTNGWREALASAREIGFADTAAMTGLDAAALRSFFALFADTKRCVTVFSQGVNQSTAGTDKVNAIINCHLATGRIGQAGMGPFSVTGQPNAMGGREVGGLANMLAAHMELENTEHRRIVSAFWGVPEVPAASGPKAVDLFRAVGDGRIKALWIMATNPADSMPDADEVRAAIARCPFVVVSDVTAETDTAVLADVRLPAAAWGEKDGTVTNSERRISRQRSFLHPPGDVRPDWWQIAEVARRMGFAQGFDYEGPDEIFREYAQLTGFENGGTRDLDISAYADVEREEYDALEPFQWPRPRVAGPGQSRMFADGRFFTPDRRARFVPVAYRRPASLPDAAAPFILNTGRVRDQWHTMTRTAKTPRLMSHFAEPFVEIHPDDAKRLALAPASLAEMSNSRGRAIARVCVTERQQSGSVFVPMHWTDQLVTSGRIDVLVAPNTDPLSGQPESKHATVDVRRFEAAWYGFAVMLEQPPLDGFDYAARAFAGQGYRLEFAGRETCDAWDQLAAELLGTKSASDGQLLAYVDNGAGQYRFAAFASGVCSGLLFVAREPVAVSRSWATDQLGAAVAADQRLGLLAGRPGQGVPDRGPIICACFGVGANEIATAIVEQGCASVTEIGACVKAGTNCGSCRSELGRLLHECQLEKAV